MHRAGLVFVLACLLALPSAAAPILGQEKPADAQLPFAYILYGPEKLAKKKVLPLVLYLHGGGERGNDLAKLRSHGPPKLLAADELPRAVADFFLVVPQCPSSCRGWPVPDLLAFIDGLQQRYPIDRDRIVVTGQSMGGIGAIALLAAEHERFAGGVALCGQGRREQAARLVKVPLWLVHGARDEVIPVSGSRQLRDWVAAEGGQQLIYEELADQGHMIHNDVYKRAAIWDWLLARKRTL